MAKAHVKFEGIDLGTITLELPDGADSQTFGRLKYEDRTGGEYKPLYKAFLAQLALSTALRGKLFNPVVTTFADLRYVLERNQFEVEYEDEPKAKPLEPIPEGVIC